MGGPWRSTVHQVKDYYEADHIIIATGAKPVIPDIPGAMLPGVLTSDRLLASDTWNYDRLHDHRGRRDRRGIRNDFPGAVPHVTIIESREHLLGPMDNEVSEVLEMN